MKLNEHSNLVGQHAFLSPSNVHWVNYTDEKLISVYEKRILAVERGTKLHEYACSAIQLKRKQPKTKDTVCMYINDAIGFGMTPEQPLFYSNMCFGTTDAIKFDEKKKLLRIHDLKTGETPAHMDQLITYAALFFLEYGKQIKFDYGLDISDIGVELRIYQKCEIIPYTPTSDEILTRMDLIVRMDKVLQDRKEEE